MTLLDDTMSPLNVFLARMRAVPDRAMGPVFACLVLMSVGIAHETVFTIVADGYTISAYSYLLAILPLSIILIWLERRAIFAHQHASLSIAIVSMGSWVALAAILLAMAGQLASSVQLAASICVLVTFWMAAFCSCFGTVATRRALFALLFLLLLIPVPKHLMDVLVTHLQHASVTTVEWLFRVAGIPFLRHGEHFALADFQMEVAKECSGIRSTVALFITGLLSGHLLLKSKWNRFALLLSIIPLAILKNGLRIFTLSALALYVDPAVMSSSLHRRGGFVFFSLALLALFALVGALMRRERAARVKPMSPEAQHSVL